VERPAHPRLQEHAADGGRAHLGHRGHAHLLDPRSQRPRRDQGVRLHEEAAAQRAALHEERRRRHAAGRLGQAGGGIFFIVDALDTKAKGYDVTISFPQEGIGTAAEGIALIKGAKNPELGKKLIDWATSPAMQSQFAKYKINFVPANPAVAIEPSLAEVLKGAKIFAIDADYAGANRKRIVDRWIAES
jgi:ABC-type Fe3+ transport system substrate-binding protein